VVALLLACSAMAAGQTPSPISPSGWSLVSADSQATGYPATNAFDGSAATFWHTQYKPTTAPLPHEIQIDLGAFYDLSSFSYLPRQDGCSNGWINQYEFYVSTDASNWGTPVAAGSFNYSGQTFGCPGASMPAARSVSFTTKTGRYIRLRAISEVNGQAFTSAAEIGVAGVPHVGNIAPNATITSPSMNPTIVTGQSVSFAGSGTDPDGNTPLSFSWDFGASGIPPSNQQNPGSETFSTAGTFTVTLTVTDQLGGTGTATRTVTVVDGSIPTEIPQSGWRLVYVDSQASGYPATNSFDGSAATFWHTQYSPTSPQPPHEIQIDLGGFYDLSSFTYLPRQDGCSNGWINQYEFYASTDGTNWGTPVAAGSFDYSGASLGCPGASVLAARSVSFSTTAARYVRLRALSSIQGMPWTSAADIEVIGVPHSGNIPPNASITSPASDITVVTGQPVNFAGSGNDPDGNTPLTYGWDFGASGIAPLNQQNPGFETFNTVGTFTVTLTVTDQLGGTGTATRTVTVLDATAAQPISQLEWKLRFVDSQEMLQYDGHGIQALDGDPSTLWHTRYSSPVDPLPHEIQIDLGNTYQISSLGYLPRQDGCSNGWIKDYEIYVSTDGLNWDSPVASGTFDYSGATLGCGSSSVVPVRTANFAPAVGRYVRLRALSEVNGKSYASAAEITLAGVPAGARIPRNGWTASADSYEATSGGGHPANLATDGSTPTYWETAYSSGVAPLPHYLQVDLGRSFSIGGFLYQPRQDMCADGWIKNYELYLSADGVNFGSAVNSGIFDYGTAATTCPGAGQPEAKFIQTTPQAAEFVRLNALSEVNGNQFSSAAEVKVMQCLSTPSVAIVRPETYFITSSANIRVTALACLDPAAQAGWGVRLMLDGGTSAGGSQADVTTAPFETVFSSVAPGEHTVDAYLIDNTGTIVAGTSAHAQVSHVAVGDYYVAMGDSTTTAYVSDDIQSDNVSSDGRIVSSGYTPVLSSLLTSSRGHPVAVFDEGVGGTTSADGVTRIVSLLAKHPDAQYFLLTYGVGDARTNIPSGVGLNPGDAGYAGSFKDNMQHIINSVLAAGKKVAPAKASIMLSATEFGTRFTNPSTAPQNILLQQYSQVVDELVANSANGITVVPPDFYNYFANHTGDFWDGIHPNGLGVQAMGNLWAQALAGH
jgi:lysophospholipase L1-like esterase